MLKNGHLRALIDEITATFRTDSCESWKKRLTEGDIPFSVAYSWPEMLDDPQANAVGAYYDCVCPNGVVRKVTHTPVRIRGEGELEGRTAPLIGQHSVEVLSEVGYSRAEIDAMLESGAAYVWQDRG